jgi:hypothetical protein
LSQPTPLTGDTATPQGGLLSDVSSVLNNPIGKLAVGAIPALATAIKGPSAVPSSIQPLTAGGAVTAPLLATEASQLGEANSGTLTPGQAATIGTYVSQASSALYQQLANEGVTNPTADSRYIAGMQQIQQQALAMTQSYINAAFTNGFSAAGAAAGDLTTAANAQVAQDTAFSTALNSAMTSFGLIEGGSSLAGLAKAA